MNEEQVIQKFADFCGEEKYAKFFETLKANACTDSRLRFWQEKLLEKFSASTGQQIPLNYRDLVRYYSSHDREVSVDGLSQSDSHLRFNTPVHREFRSANQMASGGSHITSFTVRISEKPSPYTAVIRDEVSPVDRPQALEEILDELHRGVESFLVNTLQDGKPVHSLCIELVDFKDHEIDLKPYKYAFAIEFVLMDLLCEQQCKRVVPVKTIGIPL